MKSEKVEKVVGWILLYVFLANFTPLKFMYKDKGLPWSEDKRIQRVN